MSAEKFDCIVVGAGPAGLTAAYILAKAGLQVIVIERGEFPGAKNVMGGVFYRYPLDQVIPEFWKRAPIERTVVEQRMWLLSDQAGIKIGAADQRSLDPPNNFTVLRAKFDRWLAEQVTAAGAMIITDTVVEDVIRKNGKIVGVKTSREEGDLYADCIIAADGVNSLLSKKAGLHAEIKPNQVATAVKEIIAIPKEILEARFNVPKYQGVTIEFIGKTTKGMVGIGFIYTNKETLSLGIGCLSADLVKYNVRPYELIDEIKKHPLIAPLIEGGETKEYMAHLIPEGGYKAIPPLFTDGMLVVGDAAMLVNGIHREGSNFAVESGRRAAETVLEAKKKGDFSKRTLAAYKNKLENSFVMKDLKKYSNATSLLEKNRHFITLYPELATDSAKEFLTVDGVPKRSKEWKIIWRLIKKRGLWGLFWDAITAWRMFE